jgi:hypothetical protein
LSNLWASVLSFIALKEEFAPELHIIKITFEHVAILSKPPLPKALKFINELYWIHEKSIFIYG